MKPETWSVGYKAYVAGYYAYNVGKNSHENPFTKSKRAGLQGWWSKGFEDAKDESMITVKITRN